MKKYIFGTDIGGTAIKLGLFTVDGKFLDKWEIPTRTENNRADILPDIAESIKGRMKAENIGNADVRGVGIGVPGPVGEDGIVYKCVNLGWEITNAASVFEELTGFTVKVGNDANVAALREMWQCGGRGHKNIVMVTLGTGVGGGIIIDEKIVAGANGAGGEIGHLPMSDDEKDTCGCGKHGCLEQYTSANGLVRVTERFLRRNPDCQSSLLEKVMFTAKDICDAAKE